MKAKVERLLSITRQITKALFYLVNYLLIKLFNSKCE